ncbi:hypothetical protein SAMN05660297_03512 [Natronincola peptidivorans]|uniref:Uncharacterized protein n=1 Tax=Natronincola peptidivorans TaxID=426128 RepID=A0A1I0H674_9FIRM|nr:hypothetical protein [Natronincola peptidivorans]SET79064.1 hypothetical protein SAMN05660297_03512 [Natronincola peptidivorans]
MLEPPFGIFSVLFSFFLFNLLINKTNLLDFLLSKDKSIKRTQAIIILIFLLLIPVFITMVDIKVSKEIQWLIYFPFTVFTFTKLFNIIFPNKKSTKER